MSEKEFNELVKSLLESIEVITSGANEMKKLLSAASNSKSTADAKPDVKSEEKAEDKEINHDMVRQVLSALSGSGKAYISREILSKFGANRLNELKPENYSEAYNLAKEALNG